MQTTQEPVIRQSTRIRERSIESLPSQQEAITTRASARIQEQSNKLPFPKSTNLPTNKRSTKPRNISSELTRQSRPVIDPINTEELYDNDPPSKSQRSTSESARIREQTSPELLANRQGSLRESPPINHRKTHDSHTNQRTISIEPPREEDQGYRFHDSGYRGETQGTLDQSPSLASTSPTHSPLISEETISTPQQIASESRPNQYA